MRPVHPMETTLIFEHDAMLARIAELEARVRRCHAILQDIVSVSDPSVYGEAMKELGGEFCPGTTACDEPRDRLEQADHHDGPCTVKDCQRCRAERAEARVAELEGEALLHRVLGPQRTESDMNEILSLKARIAELEAENARLLADSKQCYCRCAK